MEAQKENQDDGVAFAAGLDSSILLEFAALDDVDSFKQAVEENGGEIDRLGVWYSRRIGSKKMSYEQRTPLMIASLYGSAKVVDYLINSGRVDVNRIAGSERVSALHCAVAGGSDSSPHVVQLLLRASADPNCIDGNGNSPSDLVPRTPNLPSKKLRRLVSGDKSAVSSDAAEEGEGETVSTLKKEYSVDSSLPDINNGIYSTDEFRMYSFKIKPCSRAYTHDWTECPFAHPGENARRRDPRKYQYSCVPCPEFKKGNCKNGDNCEYAHGVFESWLHPAQYRTRLCKDETGCARKVCFFAHKKEDLRPVYAATGSALPSPTVSGCSVGNGVDMGVIGQLGVFSAAPMSPTLSPSSPKWQSRVSNSPPPSLQLAGSRLRSSLNARDLDLEMMELLTLENKINQQHQQQQQKLQMMDEVYGRIGELKPSGIDNAFGSLSSSILASLNGSQQLPQLESPSGLQLHQNLNHLRASYPLSSSGRKLSPNRLDSSPPKSVAAAMLNPRAAAFAKRSVSFVDRGAAAASAATLAGFNGSTVNLATSSMSTGLSDWSSPDGKLDWGIQGQELSKLRKSASFGFRGNNAVKTAATAPLMPLASDEPDVSWVNSLVKDAPSGHGSSRRQPYGSGNAVQEMRTPWMEQLYIEQEQMVA